MLIKVAALIDGHRTVLDIIHELRECVESQDVFRVLFTLSDWDLIVPDDFDPQTVIYWQRTKLAKQFRSLCETCEPSLRSLVSINSEENFPVFSYAAIPKSTVNASEKKENGQGKELIYTAGSGFCPQAGILAALGELAETMGLTWTGGVDITRATVKELGRKSIHPHQLLLFSERQCQNRESWRKQFGDRHQSPFSVPDDVPLDWVTATSYPDGKTYFIPAGFCFMNYPRDQKYLVADSNGCAAAPTRNQAIVLGFLELVERDAVAIWWYNRITRPGIDVECINDPEINECVDWVKRHHRRLYILDLTHDYGIPVIAAISVNGHETDIVMGFGANFDYLPAVKSALKEMLQLYSLKRIIEKQIEAGGIESLDQSASTFIRWARGDFVKAHPHMHPGGIKPHEEILRLLARTRDSKEVLQSCAALCRQKKQPFLILDPVPSSFKVPVVRIILPGTRHFRARFAPGRLYQVPVTMGWRSTPMAENGFTQRPIPI